MRSNPPPNDPLGFVYMAQPIDLAKNQMLNSTAVASAYQLPVFNPAGAWDATGLMPSSHLQKANYRILYQASRLVAGIDPRTLSIGTVGEISFAAKRGIPIQIVVPSPEDVNRLDRGSWSLAYLRGAGIDTNAQIEVAFIPELINPKWQRGAAE